MTRRSDPQWLLLAEKEDIQARAFRDVAARFAAFVMAGFIGFAICKLLTWGVPAFVAFLALFIVCVLVLTGERK